MLSTSNVALQFGPKPLFEQITVKFSDGNRYGLIGANGCGKSSLMKILGGELEPSMGDVMLQTGVRLGKLNQDQFAYEDERVLDVVMQGHTEMWQAMRERDRIYADAQSTNAEYMRAAELEGKFAEYGDYNAEARAAAILTEAGVPASFHDGPMRAVAPGLKLRVLLAQALFSKPDVLLLDEPTNHMDMETIESLQIALERYPGTLVFVSHDREFVGALATRIIELRAGVVADFKGNYDEYLTSQGIAA